jgi:hypothetical protein
MEQIPQHRSDQPKDGVLAKMYACCQVERGGEERLGTSSVPTEDTLESMGEVGVEILDGNVVSEVTVGGRESGKT